LTQSLCSARIASNHGKHLSTTSDDDALNVLRETFYNFERIGYKMKNNETLFVTLGMLSQVKMKRNFMVFFGDRIRQAATEPELLKFGERLQNLVSAEISCVTDIQK